MHVMKLALLVSLLGSLFIFTTKSAAQSVNPVVTLGHGGSLQGLRTSYNQVPVDLFLGIRYAKAPINNLRFKKPEEFPAWQGVVNAQKVGNFCAQSDAFGGNGFLGNEDCLFMDITVPGGIEIGAKKPVMVWIHGGGFTFGSASGYIGAPLAVTGDVIVVSMTYRLGIFGFLSDGTGTGNFGLWDQRQALLWVKTNIAKFGGDPDMVTIFGESAGGSSVSAQMLSPHNTGLFKRGIAQSGSMFLPFSWYLSRTERQNLVHDIRKNLNCTTNGKVYECFNNLPTGQALTAKVTGIFADPWHPVPDNDFFPTSFETNPSYELSKRYDLMSGMNAQEGALQAMFELSAIAAARNQTINNGVTLNEARDYVKQKCLSLFTPFSPNLCTHFVTTTYRLDRTRSNRDRAYKLSLFLGEMWFDVDIVNQLKQHSAGNKSTYGYYFSELYDRTKPSLFTNIPRWLLRSATHTDELPFLFGAAFLSTEKSTIWGEIIAKDMVTNDLLNQTLSKTYRPLSRNLMKMWTNFAKTGNPNIPDNLSANFPTWPEVRTDSPRFLNINRFPRVIDTPNAARLQLLEEHLVEARHLQTNRDRPGNGK